VNSLETRGLKLNWQSPTGNIYDSVSSPVVANGVVYYGSEDSGVLTGHVYALNASTGAQLWSFETGGPVDSSPAVANGVVYIGSWDHNLYALNASTGAKLWSFTTGDALESSSPAVANGVVYVGSIDGNVYALNATTGEKLWSYDTGSGLVSSPAVANGVVYIGSTDSDGHVYALNASTGAELWSYATGSSVGSSAAVANGLVYIGSGGVAYALNASTGAKVWSYANASKQIFGSSAPAVAHGVVYFEATNCFCSSGQNNSSYLYALNADTGTLLWSYLSPVFYVSSPTIVDGVLYFRTGNTTPPGPPPAPPGTLSGEIYAFGLGAAATADLYLRIRPTPDTVHQGDLLTYAFPVWNLGPDNAVHEVLTTQVPEGTTFDYIRISGTPGLGTCTTPPYEGTGEIVCHENSAMAPNTTWTVRVVVKVTAPSGTVITESATTTEDTPDPNLADNTATVSTTVQ
jgi:uncharacterized repeat protein (TIGR01451 family)